jgi:TetR/AcrR family transcriptional regulator, transcriptional repressor for nem operon
MVKVTKDVSKKHRADLLQATGQLMRADGIHAASVAAIAGKVGLTHGAIYRQFPSKDALASAAITGDFDTILAVLTRIASAEGSLRDYFEAYLAADHRDHFVWGCPIAPLAAEVGRTSPGVQAAFAEGLHRNLDAIARLSGIPDAREAHTYAISALSLLSGAMAMARATRDCDPQTSSQILAAALHSLLADPRLPVNRSA